MIELLVLLVTAGLFLWVGIRGWRDSRDELSGASIAAGLVTLAAAIVLL